jgi:hypothetical protein
MTNYLFALVFSHLLSDFIFQSDILVKRKHSTIYREKCLALFIHTFVFFCLAIVLLIPTGLTWLGVRITIMIALSHFVIDFIKTLADPQRSNILVFLIDQILHLIAIVFFIYYFLGFTFSFSNFTSSLTSLQRLYLAGCYIILITSFSNVIIQIVLAPIKKTIDDSNVNIKVGRYIGSLERVLTVIAITAGAYELLVALYGSKAAIRFGQAKDNSDFADYYILGTLISVLLGILTGLAVKITLYG